MTARGGMAALGSLVIQRVISCFKSEFLPGPTPVHPALMPTQNPYKNTILAPDDMEYNKRKLEGNN